MWTAENPVTNLWNLFFDIRCLTQYTPFVFGRFWVLSEDFVFIILYYPIQMCLWLKTDLLKTSFVSLFEVFFLNTCKTHPAPKLPFLQHSGTGPVLCNRL